MDNSPVRASSKEGWTANFMNKVFSLLGWQSRLAGAILLTALCLCLSGCRSPEGTFNPDRENFLLADEPIEKAKIYDEPEHLRKRLEDPDPAIRDRAAERLVLIDSRRANKIIAKTLVGDNPDKPEINESSARSILKALAKYKVNRFAEEIIALLEYTPIQGGLQSEIFAVLINGETESLSKMILKQLNQPDKPESVRQNLVRGLAFAPSKKTITYLVGLLTNRKTEFNAEIINSLSMITRQNFSTKDDWAKWWELNRSQTRETWLEKTIADFDRLIRDKDKLIKKNTETVSGLRMELLKLKLEQSRRTADSESEMALLTEGLDSEFAAVKKFTLEQIKNLPETEKVKQLVPKILDLLATLAPNPNGTTPHPSGNSSSNDISADQSRSELQSMILAILSTLNDERAIEPLLTIINNPKESALGRQKAYITLSKTKNPKILPELIKNVDNESPEIVLTIVEIFGAYGPDAKNTVEKLHQILKSTRYLNDEKIIKTAIDALGDIKDTSSTAVVLPFVNDTHSRVRWSAASSLGDLSLPQAGLPPPPDGEPISVQTPTASITSGQVAKELEKLLSDEFIDVRQIAITSLGKIATKDSCPALARVLQIDKDSRTRQLAAEALGKIKDKSCLPVLYTTLAENDENLSRVVWSAILSVASDNVDLMEDIAGQLRQQNQLAYAVQMLRRIIDLPKLQGNEAESRRFANEGSLGLALTEMGEYTQAIPSLKKAEDKFPDKPEFTLARIECLRKIGNYADAIKSCLELLKDQQNETNLWWKLKMELLDIYLLQKDYAKIPAEVISLIGRPSLTPEAKNKLDKIKEEADKNLPAPPPR